ncbi:unnamed protein product [Mucor hiemalis]
MQSKPPPKSCLQHLPFEIAVKITWILSKKDARQCMLVCKSWYMAALPVFYRNVFITHQKLDKLGKELIKAASTQNWHPDVERHGSLIKAIGIEDQDLSEFDSKVFLDLLLCHTPNLETLDLSYCLNLETYLRALKKPTARANIPLFGKLKFYFPYKFDCPASYTPGYWGFEGDYLMCCYNFRRSLKYLEIHNSSSKVICGNVAYSTLGFLCQFPQLTHLTLTANEAKYFINDVVPPYNESAWMENVLTHCKNLESLELLHYNGPRTSIFGSSTYHAIRVRSGLERMGEDHHHYREFLQRQNLIMEYVEEYDMLMPYSQQVKEAINSIAYVDKQPELRFPKLKKLTFVSSQLSMDEITYLSNNISVKHLRKLTLAVSRLSPIEWFTLVGFSNAFNFAHYLSQASNLNFKFAEPIPDCRNSRFRERPPTQELWTRTLLWTFFNTIRGSRDLKYTIHLTVFATPIIINPMTRFKLNAAKKSIFLEQDITINSFLYSNYMLDSTSLNRPRQVPGPRQIFLPQVAKETRHLTIDLPPTSCLQEFYNALEMFTQLESLVLSASNESSTEESSRRSIVCTSSNSGRLTHITLRRINLTHIFQQFFPKFLPNTTNLDLVDCDFCDTFGWPSRTPTLDLRYLANLQRLTMTIQANTSSYNTVIVCVYYCLEKDPQKMRRRFKLQDLSRGNLVTEKTTMTLTVLLGDQLKNIKFLQSTYQPQDIILD